MAETKIKVKVRDGFHVGFKRGKSLSRFEPGDEFDCTEAEFKKIRHQVEEVKPAKVAK